MSYVYAKMRQNYIEAGFNPEDIDSAIKVMKRFVVASICSDLTSTQRYSEQLQEIYSELDLESEIRTKDEICLEDLIFINQPRKDKKEITGICGLPGSGKSTLQEELCKYADFFTIDEYWSELPEYQEKVLNAQKYQGRVLVNACMLDRSHITTKIYLPIEENQRRLNLIQRSRRKGGDLIRARDFEGWSLHDKIAFESEIYSSDYIYARDVY